MRLIDGDALKQHYAWWGDCGADGEKYKKLFDDIIDQQPTVGEWVSVNEKLPPNDNPVLTFSPGMAMPMIVDFYDRYYGEDDGEWYEHWVKRNGKITHWRELPAPPEVE